MIGYLDLFVVKGAHLLRHCLQLIPHSLNVLPSLCKAFSTVTVTALGSDADGQAARCLEVGVGGVLKEDCSLLILIICRR